MLRALVEKTKLSKAHSKFPGLKTAVPSSLVKELKLERGDYLVWEWKVIDNKMVMTVSQEKKDESKE